MGIKILYKAIIIWVASLLVDLKYLRNYNGESFAAVIPQNDTTVVWSEMEILVPN